jgi:hypothetical protein
LTDQAWNHVYRHYLTFLYMSNAYHFYSPDPGPSHLVWFRVQYEDDSFRWVRFPDKQSALVPLQYTRSIVLGDSTDLNVPPPMPALMAMRIKERKLAGRLFRPDPTKDGEKFEGQPIPLIAEDLFDPFNGVPIPPDAYREPTEYSKLLISSYVRYVAKNYPHTEDRSIPVKNIKVYRITHQLINAGQMSVGQDPMQEVFLLPYYMGKFDTAGQLMVPQQQYDEKGNEKIKGEYDGFLYWTIPVLQVPKGHKGPFWVAQNTTEYTVHNYMLLHAGDIRKFDDDSKGEGRK